MIARRVTPSRNLVFECPVTRGASEYVRKKVPENPYREGSPHRTLYFIGYMYARDHDNHTPELDFNDLVHLSERILKFEGFPVPGRKPVRDR